MFNGDSSSTAPAVIVYDTSTDIAEVISSGKNQISAQILYRNGILFTATTTSSSAPAPGLWKYDFRTKEFSQVSTSGGNMDATHVIEDKFIFFVQTNTTSSGLIIWDEDAEDIINYTTNKCDWRSIVSGDGFTLCTSTADNTVNLGYMVMFDHNTKAITRLLAYVALDTYYKEGANFIYTHSNKAKFPGTYLFDSSTKTIKLIEYAMEV